MSSDHSASRSSVGAAGAVWVLLGQCGCYWGSVGATGAVWVLLGQCGRTKQELVELGL